ncbi:hypothetical protein T02_4882 [Trichinella nativa]|uniref:Uncharacterized protein n=1 Tax=Trichinella nativa TaxID=6335 RepID=A0A0V1KYA7_9BILA|nr:hypothetical protein T02_4882 [Trichinella nativa]
MAQVFMAASSIMYRPSKRSGYGLTHSTSTETLVLALEQDHDDLWKVRVAFRPLFIHCTPDFSKERKLAGC